MDCLYMQDTKYVFVLPMECHNLPLNSPPSNLHEIHGDDSGDNLDVADKMFHS
uniref:Uncharacterized protein n=1 Tax=Arion vulgaris TaxID=1028688 RepID=A0A0B7BVW9_9EUPU